MSLYLIPFACEYSVNQKCHFLIRQVHGSGSLREPYHLQHLFLSSVAIKGATLVLRIVQSFCQTEL